METLLNYLKSPAQDKGSVLRISPKKLLHLEHDQLYKEEYLRLFSLHTSVLDPFCGSYTTLPEARLLGRAAESHPNLSRTLYGRLDQLFTLNNILLVTNPPWYKSKSFFKLNFPLTTIHRYWHNMRLRIVELRRIFINGLRTMLGDDNFLESLQELQKKRAQLVFRQRNQRRDRLKAIIKPLKIIPQSLHPIEFAAH